MRVGVIGLGNIGRHVATNLAADGHELRIHDRDPARVAALTGSGAIPSGDPAELARDSEITFLSLPTPAVVDEVADAWITGAAPGAVLVDLSTNAPSAVRRLGERVEAGGGRLLEAPLTGGAPGAARRKLVFLCGGDADTFEHCRPVLESLGRAVFHVGGLGRGNVAKLVNSLLAFTSTWVSLEGLALAAKAGIDLRTMVEIVRTGGASNFYMDRMVEGLDQRGRDPMFALALAAKDAGLIRDLASEQGVEAPVADAIARVFAAAADGGLADHDWSDVVLWMERLADIRLTLER